MSGFLDVLFYPLIMGASFACSQGDGIGVGYEFQFDQKSFGESRPYVTCEHTGNYSIPFTQEKFHSDFKMMREKINEEYNDATNSGIRWEPEPTHSKRDF